MRSKNIILFFLMLCSVTLHSKSDTVIIRLKPLGLMQDRANLQTVLNKKYDLPVKVILATGNYHFNGPLLTRYDNLFITAESNAYINILNGTDFLVIGNNFVKISNLNLKGNAKTAKDFYHGRGITITGANNVIIANNSFSQISGLNIFLSPKEGKGCSYNQVINNRIVRPAFNISTNGDEAAIMLGYSGTNYFHENNIVQNNYIDGNDAIKIGIGIIGHGKNNTIKNNIVKNCLSYGIVAYESQSEDNALSGTKITGNSISNIGEVGLKKTVKGMGIYLMKSHNSLIEFNIVENTLRNSDRSETLTQGAIGISGASYVTVRSNTIKQSEMYGIVCAYAFNSSISNNNIQDVRRSGLYIANLSDMKVENNIFRNIQEVMLKGSFGNTTNKVYAQNRLLPSYKNKATGTNIVIAGNIFYNPKDILFFSGQQAKPGFIGNEIGNNAFRDNKIVEPQQPISKMINFRIVKENGNKIINNRILK